MKVRITYTVDLTEDERKAIGLASGKELGTAATYDETLQFYHSILDKYCRDATAFPLAEYYRMLGSKYRDMAKEVTTTE